MVVNAIVILLLVLSIRKQAWSLKIPFFKYIKHNKKDVRVILLKWSILFEIIIILMKVL